MQTERQGNKRQLTRRKREGYLINSKRVFGQAENSKGMWQYVAGALAREELLD